MTDGERRAYSRGYFRGSSGKWPDHQPPRPPDEVMGSIVDALHSLRDAVDTLCAQLDDDDSFVTTLGPEIDKADAALARLGVWVREWKSGAAALGVVTTGSADTETPSADDADEHRGDGEGMGAPSFHARFVGEALA